MTPLQEDTRFRVLRALQDNPRLTQRELSERLGVSLGATNFVLRALMEKGAIKIRNFRGNTRKLSYAYILTPHGLAEKASLTARFLARKQKEYESLKAEIEAVSRELEQETLPATDACTDSEPMAAPPLAGADPR
jgi:EPS-associated MarR family transcriptional regulator